jgi:hypothetical protein
MSARVYDAGLNDPGTTMLPWYFHLPIVFVYTAVLWVVVLLLYNVLFEPFDFGSLGFFAGKSAILVFLIALTVTFVRYGDLASLPIWWIGLMVIFKKDLLECRILVVLIWGTNFLVSLAMGAMFMSAGQSPVSTVP